LLSDSWSVAAEYDLSVDGPNGFHRRFSGTLGQGANLKTEASYDGTSNTITLLIANFSGYGVAITVSNVYSGNQTHHVIDTGNTLQLQRTLHSTFGWYDFVITVDHDTTFENRLAGHLENGQNSFTDPLMGRLT
jgi:phospholipase C